MSYIKLSSFSYRYPNSPQPALVDVSIEIAAGSLALVIGESGSGKSTLLRCLNGLVPHFTGGHVSGSVRVAGLDPVREGPARMALTVGMVFQDPESQFVLDRVEDEIAFALENLAIFPGEMVTRVNDVLRVMDIEALRGRSISSLSGGEQQRVAVAAAVVLRPSVLVLDEPTSQLDPESADDVMQMLTRLNRDLGLTVVLAEHRLERVLPYAHQVIQVESGRVSIGPPREMMAASILAPPVVSLGRLLGWSPVPLSVEEARAKLAQVAPRDRLPPQVNHREQPGVNQPQHGVESTKRLQVDELRVSYGEHAVLRNVDLSINNGEIVALMGRNGAGKSTLLKSAIGLVRITSGQVWINGLSIAGRDTTDICHDVAYLPQNPNALLFADTVTEELRTTLRNHHQEGSEPIAPLLVRLGLTRYRDAYPRDLSVGERERVALGAVCVTEPMLFMLDEPTRGLDYTAKRVLVSLLRAWTAEGAGVLVVTHDVEFVAECADRVVMLADGCIVADGAPRDVLPSAPIFTPQIAQVFPGTGWMNVQDVHGLSNTG